MPLIYQVFYLQRDQVAERLGSRTINQKVVGWIPGFAK